MLQHIYPVTAVCSFPQYSTVFMVNILIEIALAEGQGPEKATVVLNENMLLGCWQPH